MKNSHGVGWCPRHPSWDQRDRDCCWLYMLKIVRWINVSSTRVAGAVSKSRPPQKNQNIS